MEPKPQFCSNVTMNEAKKKDKTMMKN